MDELNHLDHKSFVAGQIQIMKVMIHTLETQIIRLQENEREFENEYGTTSATTRTI
jgi:hypothetical protein